MTGAAAEYDHAPVMLDEVLDHLAPADGGVYVDATFGRGGYARAIVSHAACTLIGIDRDPEAIAAGQGLAADYPGRVVMVRGKFGDLAALVNGSGYERIDGLVMDLGVSSPQLDVAARGFSFRAEGPLDMRMTPGEGESAADLVNEMDEKDLADLIYAYGEERHSRRIARAVVRAREQARITTTTGLAEIVRQSVPGRPKDGIDPATRTFQALRIAVNDELGELERALEAALHVLRPGGVVVVVSFHSLEDRRVKQFFRHHSGRDPGAGRHMPVREEAAHEAAGRPCMELVTRKALRPGEAEQKHNPRARSARLRAARRTDVPAAECYGAGGGA